MRPLATITEIDSIGVEVDAVVPQTPQFSWPLLNARSGCELWVKHENHTANGSFKIRGAVNYVNRLLERDPSIVGVIAATRGNYGQAVAFAARRRGLSVTIVVPHGNSVEKNKAMRAQGVELLEHGDDFQAALVHTEKLAAARGLHWVPAYHRDLALGNAVSMARFLRSAPPLDCVYIPIGMGSGICALMAARDALGLTTRVIGVAAERAPAIALSFRVEGACHARGGHAHRRRDGLLHAERGGPGAHPRAAPSASFASRTTRSRRRCAPIFPTPTMSLKGPQGPLWQRS
jgi:threonine dehydratase